MTLSSQYFRDDEAFRAEDARRRVASLCVGRILADGSRTKQRSCLERWVDALRMVPFIE